MFFNTYNVGLIIRVDILGDSTQAPGNNVSIRNRNLREKKGPPDRRHSNFGTLRVAKEILEKVE